MYSINDYTGYGGYSYGGSSSADTMNVLMIVAAILALIAVIVVFITVLPAKKRDRLPKGLKIVHDICNFNGLIVEKILKALYIFATVFSIFYFLFAMFADIDSFLIHFLCFLIVPFVIRIIFEFMMMAILLVKNVIAINLKLKNQNEGEKSDNSFDFDYSQFKAPAPEAAPAPVVAPAPEAPAATFCTNCGSKVEAGNAFCTNCGKNING